MQPLEENDFIGHIWPSYAPTLVQSPPRLIGSPDEIPPQANLNHEVRRQRPLGERGRRLFRHETEHQSAHGLPPTMPTPAVFPDGFTSRNDADPSVVQQDNELPSLSGARPRSRSESPSRPRRVKRTPWSAYDDDKQGDKWGSFSKALRLYDQSLVEACKDDIDTLLVFAGLFSAVLTAFNIESYKTLRQDSADTTAAALVQISRQLSNLTTSGNTIISAQPSFAVSSFQRPASAVRINSLWFSALILSLIAASLGMLVKQWLREYLIGHFTSPQESVRVRHFRWEGLQRWRVFDIAAALPILLQIALILFFVGLSDFLRQLDLIVGWVASGLIILWLILFSISILAPAVSYQCPYKVPLLRNVTHFTRSLLSFLLRRRPINEFRPFSFYPGDERGVRLGVQYDIPAMIGADNLTGDDDFLEQTLRPCLSGEDSHSAVQFVRGILANRLHKKVNHLKDIGAQDLDHVTNKSLNTSMSIVIDVVNSVIDAETDSKHKSLPRVDVLPWTFEALEFLFCALHHTYHRDRPLEKAVENGMLLQKRLLASDKYRRECLVLLSRYQYVRVEAPPLDSRDVDHIIKILRSLITESRVEPIHLCRVTLTISRLQPDPTIMLSDKRTYHDLLLRLSAAIQNPGSAADTAKFCLRLTHMLNDTERDFVHGDLLQALRRIAEKPVASQPMDAPTASSGLPLARIWSKPKEQPRQANWAKPLPRSR